LASVDSYLLIESTLELKHPEPTATEGDTNMEGLTGFAAVVMFLALPLFAIGMYTFYRVRKLRSEERLAAMQRGVNIPIEAELSESAKSRRYGILLVAGAVGYMMAFTIVARYEPDAMIAAAFGAIPFTLGLGYFLDSTLIRRDQRAAS
jgi:hypothetical protein